MVWSNIMEREDISNRPGFERPTDKAAGASVEAVVTDARAGLTPAQMVERKLVCLLRNQPLPLSRRPTHPVTRRALS
jgi:hypothetical protein